MDYHLKIKKMKECSGYYWDSSCVIPWQRLCSRSASQSRYRSRLRDDRSSWDCEAFNPSSVFNMMIIITWGRIWGSWTPSLLGCWTSWWWCSRPCRRDSARARSQLRASVHASQYLTRSNCLQKFLFPQIISSKIPLEMEKFVETHFFHEYNLVVTCGLPMIPVALSWLCRL